MDEKLALEAVVSTSTVPYLEGLKEYMELGYVPMEKSGSSASVTLEYGYDDWAIYHMAKKMGDREVADTYLPINIWWTSVWVLSGRRMLPDR